MPSPKKHSWILYFFGIALLADIIVINLNLEAFRYLTKPLLLILLLIFVFTAKALTGLFKTLLTTALLFSLCGDVLLLFDSKNSLFFIFGLLSFLIAHVFYILLFLSIKKRFLPEKNLNHILIGLVLLYTAFLLNLLFPGLNQLKIPVFIYAMILCGMFIAAAHSFNFSDQPGRMIITGALLFVISDSILATNKFYKTVPFASSSIMFTYGLAQLLITYNIVIFFNKQHSISN